MTSVGPHTPASYAARKPDHPAVIMAESGETLTYGQLAEETNRTIRLLRSEGLQYGDHLAVMVENSLTFYPIVWAALLAGFYVTPINTRLTSDEVRYILDDCEAKAFFVSARFAQVASAVQSTAVGKLSGFFSIRGELTGYRELLSELRGHTPEPVGSPSQGSPMMYSSGTTGQPKGIKRVLATSPVGQLDIFTDKIAQVYGFGEETVYLCPAPIYHGAGLSYTTMMHRLGATAVVMEKFSPEGFLATIERYRVSHTQVVPTMFVRMLKLPEATRHAHDLSSLKVLIHAAAPCPPEVKEAMLDWVGPIVYEYLAATEANGYTFITPQEWVARRGSVGRAMIGVIHIVDDDGTECPIGTPGMVYFEGVAAFEYHNDDAKTAESRHPKGWTTTGDIGYVDADGYLYLTDRKAFTIISGGVNIYPQEIENLLAIHPDVMDAAVFGVPDPEFQEQVKAVVQLADQRKAGPDTERLLIEYCRSKLAHYKCPKSVDFVEQLPRMENGKLYKRLLRDQYWGNRNTRIV